METGVEHDLPTDLGDDRHIGWIHEHDMEHRDGKAGR